LFSFRKAIAQRFSMGLLAILCLFFIGACPKRAGSRNKSEGGPAVPVTVAIVERKTTSVEINIFGTVQAYASVEVKAQITGILDKVHFTEGQPVKKGELLLSIDPREPQAALKLAQANLQKDEAQLRNAEKEAARQRELFSKGFSSQDEYDKSTTLVETFLAAVAADKAAVENAQLRLDYCSIRSPIDGCIGSLHVHQGNLVKENDVSVVTINQTDPIYVTFSVPEQYLPAIQKYKEANNLDVRAIQPYEKGEPARGTLSFVDNAVDSNTRTIRLRATFLNKDGRLWPVQYVNVTLTLTQEPNSLVIPTQAVQTGQNNQFVYVVKPDTTVEARPITVIRTLNSETVVEGVAPGEAVVTDGQLRLVPGAKVQAKPAQK
jgi:multidrug efflux system membrane fusion protein